MKTIRILNPYTSVGVIGDVHCEHQSLALAINTLQDYGVEAIVCTGDVPTGQGDVNACCELLEKHRIPTVRGNHDRWLLTLPSITLPHATDPSLVSKSSWSFLESLPVTIDLPTVRGPALLCHGLGQEDMLTILTDQSDVELGENPILYDIVEADRYRFIISGHSHERMVRRYQSLTMINAGTLRRDHNPCFAAIDFRAEQFIFWDIWNQKTIERSHTQTF